ncbi:unnamed protein product [Medioppia subpectinata]|uniref:Uncharacterized protein n=1 Tax=Medioppia subpectinata TaxID=1979941 RepID=A0A7R9LR64_9ACAR|nr:unnamed protein product [Medioppia subpectinata]CAG2120456.1 unnamed protein product [Medioppia subpectinata]
MKMHVVPNPVIMTPAKFHFQVSRLWTLLKRNPRHWGSVGSVFVIVPTMASVSAYHSLHSPDTILTRANPEPWHQFDHKQHKFRSHIDHQHYDHPRPRF